MTITEQREYANYYTVTLSDGSIWNIGKQSESNPNGAANYDEAYAILLMNIPDLEL